MSQNFDIKNFLKRQYIRIGKPAEQIINRFRNVKLRDVIKEESISTGTEYFDDVDPLRLRSLSSYQTTESKQELSTTLSNINNQFFAAYGPEYDLKTAANVSIDPAWYYQDLLTRVQAIPNLKFATCKDGLENPPTGDQILCTIRHDVDGDLVAAIQQAKIEHNLNIPTSYYLLHNAPYYGVLQEQGTKENKFVTTFARHSSSVKAYLDIQNLGHELALHTDGMDYYQRLSTDGSKAVKTEIEWLRKQNCHIGGTTAHNSFSVYGCNNYSIFKNRPLGMSTPAGPKAVVHNGNWAPLQLLDEKALGLEYEANDYFWQDSIPLLYGCLMTQNNWYIAENQYGLLSPETKSSREPLKGRYGTHDDMIDAISKLTGPAYVKLVVHPMHYGLRSGDTEDPWLPEEPVTISEGKVKMWAGGGLGNEIRGAAISYINEFKTPDRGINCYKSGDFRIAVLGEKNTNSDRVSADTKFPQVTARMVRGPLAKPSAIAISAATNSSFSQDKAISDLTRISSTEVPDVVILEIETIPSNDNQLIEFIDNISKNHKLIIILHTTTNQKNTGFVQENIIEINPIHSFEKYTGSGLIYWEDEQTWAPQAHFLIAQLLSTTIIDFFKR